MLIIDPRLRISLLLSLPSSSGHYNGRLPGPSMIDMWLEYAAVFLHVGLIQLTATMTHYYLYKVVFKDSTGRGYGDLVICNVFMI